MLSCAKNQVQDPHGQQEAHLRVGSAGAKTGHFTLAGSSCEVATFQAAVLYQNVRPDISTKGNLFEFM